MKPCNELEIVGIKSMDHSKDYYAGYDAAEKNYIRILDKIRAEIKAIEVNGQVDEHTMFTRSGEQVKRMALDIIDKYRKEQEDADSR